MHKNAIVMHNYAAIKAACRPHAETTLERHRQGGPADGPLAKSPPGATPCSAWKPAIAAGALSAYQEAAFIRIFRDRHRPSRA